MEKTFIVSSIICRKKGGGHNYSCNVFKHNKIGKGEWTAISEGRELGIEGVKLSNYYDWHGMSRTLSGKPLSINSLMVTDSRFDIGFDHPHLCEIEGSKRKILVCRGD